MVCMIDSEYLRYMDDYFHYLCHLAKPIPIPNIKAIYFKITSISFSAKKEDILFDFCSFCFDLCNDHNGRPANFTVQFNS